MILCQVSGTDVFQNVPVSLPLDASYQLVLFCSVLSALGVRSNPSEFIIENTLLVRSFFENQSSFFWPFTRLPTWLEISEACGSIYVGNMDLWCFFPWIYLGLVSDSSVAGNQIWLRDGWIQSLNCISIHLFLLSVSQLCFSLHWFETLVKILSQGSKETHGSSRLMFGNAIILTRECLFHS